MLISVLIIWKNCCSHSFGLLPMKVCAEVQPWWVSSVCIGQPTIEDALTTRYGSSVCRCAATRVLTGTLWIQMRVLSVSSCCDSFQISMHLAHTVILWLLPFLILVYPTVKRSTVVKVLCYKSEGRWFDPSLCQWIFHWHKILPITLWPWGRLSL